MKITRGRLSSPPPSLTEPSIEPWAAQQLSAAHPEQLQVSQQRSPPVVVGILCRLIWSHSEQASRLPPSHFCTEPSATQGLPSAATRWHHFHLPQHSSLAHLLPSMSPAWLSGSEDGCCFILGGRFKSLCVFFLLVKEIFFRFFHKLGKLPKFAEKLH